MALIRQTKSATLFRCLVVPSLLLCCIFRSPVFQLIALAASVVWLSTELVFALLFTPIVGTGLAGSASLLYRFATFVFPFVLGMFMVIGRRIRGAYASRNL